MSLKQGRQRGEYRRWCVAGGQILTHWDFASHLDQKQRRGLSARE